MNMGGLASKAWVIAFASAAAACSPSEITKCEKAALAHYCTAVTQILAHATGGLLGAVFLAKSSAYQRLGNELGYHHLKSTYFEAASSELTPPQTSRTINRLIAICFSHKPAAVRGFVEATGQTCRAEKEG